jgi:cell division protein FtsN
MTSREPELYKDKIEVSLDGRQIFYLFFGGAVIVGVVFVLGVLVGRRVEARGHIDQARTQTATDPLAALDRLEGSGGLSFQGALTGKDGGRGGAVEKKIDQLEKARAAVEPEKKSAKKKDDEPKAETKPETKAKPEPAADKPVTKPEHDDKEAKAEKSEKADKPEESKARFTLQLSSFQDKSEAQAFLETVRSAGFQATLTQAEVDGKGTFYRVRMGTYRSLEAANDAKSEFEKTAKKSASVMRL